MLKWSWDDAWVQKRVFTKKFAIYRRVSYETNSLTEHRLAGVTSACKHRGRIRTWIVRKSGKERRMFPLHFVGNVTRQGDRGSAMTGRVILPRRYSVPELQTNAHRADDWIPSCRIFDKKHARYFAERKRCIDIDTLQCRKNFTPSRRKSK